MQYATKCPRVISDHRTLQGYAEKPYPWSPHTVDVQMFRVGNLVMLIIPGEMTTMAGRRIRYVHHKPTHSMCAYRIIAKQSVPDSSNLVSSATMHTS